MERQREETEEISFIHNLRQTAEEMETQGETGTAGMLRDAADKIHRLQRAEEERDQMPWEDPILVKWDIVGMNHYRGDMGERHLYVAMTRGDFCITAEGPDEEAVFDKLKEKAVTFLYDLESESEESGDDPLPSSITQFSGPGPRRA